MLVAAHRTGQDAWVFDVLGLDMRLVTNANSQANDPNKAEPNVADQRELVANANSQANDPNEAAPNVADQQEVPNAGGGGAAATSAPADQAQPAGWQTALNAWRDANDAVNDQISELREKLLNPDMSGSALTELQNSLGPDEMKKVYAAFADIADKGLNSITKVGNADLRVRLMVAISDVGDGSAAAVQEFGGTALKLITGFEDFLSTNKKIASCDSNPIGASVSIRATLSPPLQQLTAALRAAMAAA